MQGYMKMLDGRVDPPKKKMYLTYNVPLMRKLIPDGALVLDFGCGNGSLGFLGRDPAKDVTVDGYDSDASNAKAKYHCLADIDGTFDCIVLAQLIEHCTVEQAIEVIEWCAPRCREIFITTPNAFDNIFVNFYNDITHVRPYNTPDLLYFLKANGFNQIDVYLTDITRNPFRILFALLSGTSPFYNYMVHAKK